MICFMHVGHVGFHAWCLVIHGVHGCCFLMHVVFRYVLSMGTCMHA